ncbi:hypothetical protein MMC18_008237 [Xylographa bjoerkii]|nr:hypothetical protein [Xylographa bjoerkii]
MSTPIGQDRHSIYESTYIPLRPLTLTEDMAEDTKSITDTTDAMEVVSPDQDFVFTGTGPELDRLMKEAANLGSDDSADPTTKCSRLAARFRGGALDCPPRIPKMSSLKAFLHRHLHTNRLVLELFDYSPAHYACLLAAMKTATVHTNMGDYGIRTTIQFDALNLSSRLSPSVCGGRIPDIDVYYLLRLGDQSGPLMGAVSLCQRAEATPPDIGWCLLEEYMGQGYAAEAGRELLRFVCEEMKTKEVIAWPGSGNTRSMSVARKIGFVEGGEVRVGEGGINTVFVLPGMNFDGGMALSIWGRQEEVRDGAAALTMSEANPEPAVETIHG